jgi:glucose-1-phosphate thymidylyltransferase
MKAVIPAAGIGTRLRPHTLNKPKALLPVAGKPILAHIMDDLTAAGIDGFVLIVGYHGEEVRRWFTRERPDLDITFVEQTERLGLGHAIWTAREVLGNEPFFCILGDTILKADYASFLASPHNMIAVREVDDPRRFGVVEMDGDRVKRFVEKPDVPPSNLAIVGAYLFRDGESLWRSLDRIVSEDIRTRGEYQLTDALQMMVEDKIPFNIVGVTDWYDCGKKETWLQTNRILLEREADAGDAEGVVAPCSVARDAVVTGSRIGPNVSVGAGTVLENCRLSDCVIGEGSRLVGCSLEQSLVGDQCVLTGISGEINVGDFSEITAQAD